MIPAAFDYVRAGSAEEAISLIGQHGDEAKFLAGGHSLLPLMKLRLAQPSVLQTAQQSGAICRGAPPPEGAILNGLLWKALKVPPPRQVAVAPIGINGRTVCIVYGHPVDGGEISDATIAALDRVCTAASAAFARLILAAR